MGRRALASLLATVSLIAGGILLAAGTATAHDTADSNGQTTSATTGRQAAVADPARSASTLGAAWDETGQPLLAWACPDRWVCFWTDPGGTGLRCAWPAKDGNWTSPPNGDCSWADDGIDVESVWNRKFRGAGGDRLTGVVYFHDPGFEDRIGCTRPGKANRGNLAGTYTPASHKWTKGSCG